MSETQFCFNCGHKIDEEDFCPDCGNITKKKIRQSDSELNQSLESDELTKKESTTRPIGITVIAILSIVLGLVGILGGALGVLSSELEVLAVSFLSLIIGIISLPVGYGLLKGKRWAWTLAIGINLLSVIISIGVFVSGDSDASSVIVGIVITALIVGYLMKPSTKAFCSNK